MSADLMSCNYLTRRTKGETLIDIDNYIRAIAWLRRSLIEFQQYPDSALTRLGILHTFEVTHNLSEAMLREAYTSLKVDEHAPNISLREILRRAAEEGIELSSPGKWLQYGLLLEHAKETWFETADFNPEAILAILPQYAAELDAFAVSVQTRMAQLG